MRYIPLLLVAVMLISGCAGVRTEANNGLVINDFSVEPGMIESGRPFRVFLEVENVGGTTARNVRAYLFGASWISDSTRIEKWGNRVITPPDAFTRSPGGTLTTFWDINDLGPAPPLPEGVVHTFKLTGRVTYEYSTSAVANIQMFNEEEFLRKKALGEPVEESISVSNTNAPIKVSVEGASPILVRNPIFENTPNEEAFYKIHFLNVGSGVPITEGSRGEITGLVGGRVRIQGEGVMFDNCFGKSGTDIDIPLTEEEGALIRGSSSALIPCTILVDRMVWQTKSQGTASIVFDLHYKYYVDRTDDLTVVGRKRVP